MSMLTRLMLTQRLRLTASALHSESFHPVCPPRPLFEDLRVFVLLQNTTDPTFWNAEAL
jgi:hypothetical protein